MNEENTVKPKYASENSRKPGGRSVSMKNECAKKNSMLQNEVKNKNKKKGKKKKPNERTKHKNARRNIDAQNQ